MSYGNRGHGGSDVVLRDIVLELPKHGIEPVCLFGRSGPLAEELNGVGIKTFRAPYRGWLCYQQDVIYKIADFYLNGREGIDIISKIIKEEKIDLVVTNTLMMMDSALAAYQLVAEGRAEAVWNQMAECIEDEFISKAYAKIARDEGFHSNIGAMKLEKLMGTAQEQARIEALVAQMRRDLYDISCRNTVAAPEGLALVAEAYGW